MPSDDFEEIVSQHYEALYRFALSLTRTETDACDLTQQTFYIWATKGHQLRDRSKVKSWLFTILHREFLQIRRRAVRFPHFELSEGIDDLPAISPEMVNTLDAARVFELLGQVQEPYRAVLTLFYVEDYSYKEIADILEVPLGTVRSRIFRGMAQLRQLILMGTGPASPRAVPEPDTFVPDWLNLSLSGSMVGGGNI
ncbi:MAG TPA: RNA polymerase sigma factor [Bryobacteraceae bacterium]|nr:RNA polymerase sigma factor [Bryobacteraceae bacterium]